MFINTKEEIEISNLISQLKNDDKNIERLISIRNKISELVHSNKFNIIDLIFDYLDSDVETIPSSLFESFLEEALQSFDKDNKKYLLIGIPIILLDAKIKNKYVYDDREKKIDDELGFLKDIIEKRVNEPFGDNIKVKIHGKMIDYANFDNRYENIIKLFSNISENKIDDNPILQGNSEYFDAKASSFDCLKFMVGVVEIDLNSDKEKYTNVTDFLENINNITFTDDDLVEKFQLSFLQKDFIIKKVMIGKSSLLLHSIKESIRLFYYFSDFNAMSSVFHIEKNPRKLYCNISLISEESRILAEFYHVDDDTQYIYRLHFEIIIDGYENELKKIVAILNKLEIRYDLFDS
jgi:hypothetical protein